MTNNENSTMKQWLMQVTYQVGLHSPCYCVVQLSLCQPHCQEKQVQCSNELIASQDLELTCEETMENVICTQCCDFQNHLNQHLVAPRKQRLPERHRNC